MNVTSPQGALGAPVLTHPQNPPVADAAYPATFYSPLLEPPEIYADRNNPLTRQRTYRFRRSRSTPRRTRSLVSH